MGGHVLIDGNSFDKCNDMLEEIYKIYSDRMFNLAFYYLKDKGLAEDIVQEAIIKIREKILKKEIISCHKIGGLIGYIVKGLCINLIKRNQKVIYREIYDTEARVEENFISDIILNDTINKLPDKYRDVFIMKFVNDMSYDEISSNLGLSESAVRKRMERARKLIKEMWGGDIYG